jgi:membrane protease YdiL (CAAX protease family)
VVAIGTLVVVMDGSRPAGPPLRLDGATLPPPSGPPAGWYPDPFGRPVQRYFDGRGWTDIAAPSATTAPTPHPTLPIQVAVGAIAVLTASLVAARLLTANILRFDLPIVVYVAILAAVAYGPSVWWATYATQRWGSGDRRTDLGLRFRWSDLGWGPVVWLAALGGQIVMVVIVTLLRVPLSGNVDDVRSTDLDRTYIIVQAITAVVAAPIVEEIVFRGMILRGFLSRMGWVPAVILQGVLFGCAHIGTADGLGNIGLALVLGGVGTMFGGGAYLLRRTGPTILAHAIFNGVVLIIVLTVDLPR